MKSHDAVEVFRALGDPVRLRIVRILLESSEVACTRLEQDLSIGKSSLSYHIRCLRLAGLIHVRKDGRYYHYTLKSSTINQHMPGLLLLIAALPDQDVVDNAASSAQTTAV